MTRCILLKRMHNTRLEAGTRGTVLMVNDDSRLKVLFDGQYNPHLLPARLVKIIYPWCKL